MEFFRSGKSDPSRLLSLDSRKFAVARLAPKKYGDQISHDGHGGAALNFQPAILIRVTGAAEADVRSASEEADGVLLDANG